MATTQLYLPFAAHFALSFAAATTSSRYDPPPAVERGTCAKLIASFAWEGTVLGARTGWPPSLQTAVAIMLDSPMSIAILMGRDGVLLYNDGYARIAGNRHPHALGVPVATSWPEIAPFNQHVIDTCLKGESLSFRDERMVLHRYGAPEDVWLDIDYAPLRDSQGMPVGVFATVADTTGKIRAQVARQHAEDVLDLERKATEDAKDRLVTESDFLRAMFERSPNFMAVLRGADHRFELANEPYRKLIGGMNVIGRTVREALPEVVGQGFIDLLDAVYRTGEPYVGRGVRIALPSGDGGSLVERVLDFVYQPMRSSNGDIVGIMAEGTDITEHFVAHERLRIAQEAGGVGTFEWFPETGRVEASDRYRELWGIAPGVPIDTASLVERVHPDDRAALGPAREGVAANALEYSEFRVTRADTGEVRWVARRGERLDGIGGKPAHYFGAAFDITQRKRSEERAAFLLQLSDRLHNAEGAEDVTLSIAADLGALLNVSRIGYANVEPDGSIEVVEDWSDGTVGRLLESRGLALFGPVLRDRLTSGDLIAINDVSEDRHTHRVSEEFVRANIRTLVLAPLADGTRIGSLLYVKGSKPRRWSGQDLGLVHEVAQRMRLANERRRAQTALRESESQFRSLVEAVPHQVWIGNPDGGLIWFNSRVYEYTGAHEGDLDGDNWARVVHPDDIGRASAQWRDCIRDGTVYETEFRLKHRDDGAWRWFLARAVPVRDAQGEVVRWLGTNTDVHAQKTAASELSQLNQVLEQRVEERTRDRESMWRLSTDLMIVTSTDGRIISMNPAWTTLLGWADSEVVGKRLADFCDPADRDLLEADLGDMAVAGPARRFEGRYLHRDGTFRWMAWTTVSDGRFVHAAGRDITGEKEASLALSQAEEALRQSQKMEAVGQLTGGIAHDFNNLLQGITGSLDLVRSRIAQGRTDEVGRFVTSAMASANRATALTHRLLAFSRRQPLSPKTVHINDMVRSLEELLRRTMGERIELDFALGDALWDTLCDPNQLESSLLNLAINARDAMPDGGRLTVETANVTLDHDDADRPRELKPGQFVALTVTDSGTGMSPEVMERAFDPFFTTKPIGQGTGLGLSMIYGFARQSEGGVKIESTVSVGTTVRLYLPRSGAVAREEAPATAPAQAHRAEDNEVVLVVEDEPIVRALVVEVLGDLGYKALEAGDGPAGLEILRSKQRIDLLITDIGLPGLNGRQVADGARAVRPDLKVLFMTGYAENAAYSRGFLERGMTMITKPFALDALEERIREMMKVERVGSE